MRISPLVGAGLIALHVVSPIALAARQAPARDATTVPAAGTGTIAGIVVTAGEPSQPARRVTVTIGGATILGGRAVVTDETGRFEFARLPAGQYTLAATKPAYLRASYGATSLRTPPTPISVVDGAAKSDIRLTLVRGAVIAGRITDERGEPLSDMEIQLLAYRPGPSGRQLADVTPSVFPGRERTDYDGYYRLYGLEAGEYVVGTVSWRSGYSNGRVITDADIAEADAALQRKPVPARAAASGAPPRAPTMGMAAVYYPGTSDVSSAAPVKVDAGEERTGIDFTYRPVATSRVDGVVINPAGPLPTNVDVRLVRVDATAAGRLGGFIERLPLRPRPDGRFTFEGIAPGEYALTATTPPPGRGGPPSDSLWATTNVTVAGADVSNLALSLQPGLAVSGRVAFDASTLQPPALEGVRVFLTPILAAGQVSVGQFSGQTDPEGRFSLQGIMPGRYTVRALPPVTAKGWLLRSVVSGGRDVADVGLDIAPGTEASDLVATFTDRIGEITGVFQDASGRPAPEYTVILFSTDRALWRTPVRRVVWARPASDGRFTLRNLLPGEYLLAAAAGAEPAAIADIEFLEQLAAAAITLTLAEGEKKTQDIRIR
jgi:protocatechuate 3,4-dioxygenase beta subunit